MPFLVTLVDLGMRVNIASSSSIIINSYTRIITRLAALGKDLLFMYFFLNFFFNLR